MVTIMAALVGHIEYCHCWLEDINSCHIYWLAYAIIWLLVFSAQVTERCLR